MNMTRMKDLVNPTVRRTAAEHDDGNGVDELSNEEDSS